MSGPTSFQPSTLHNLWRLMPSGPRRRMLAEVAALLAPRIANDGSAPNSDIAASGIAVAGSELSRNSGLGEGARLILRGLETLGVPTWPIDISRYLPAAAASEAPRGEALPPPGVPLLIHVNAPLLPLVLWRMPKALTRDRRVIGFWNWEMPAAPPEWRTGARFAHEVWVSSHFTAQAMDPLLPGRVRVVPFPLAVAPPISTGARSRGIRPAGRDAVPSVLDLAEPRLILRAQKSSGRDRRVPRRVRFEAGSDFCCC